MTYKEAIGITEPKVPAILVQIKNTGALAATQGGTLGKVAQAIAPSTIGNKVIDEMISRMRTDFKKNGVDAEVFAVDAKEYRASLPIGEGALFATLGAVAMGILWITFGGGR